MAETPHNGSHCPYRETPSPTPSETSKPEWWEKQGNGAGLLL
jgi:hypothetical protein